MVSYIGGVFQSSMFRSSFIEHVQRRMKVSVHPPIYSAAAGAVLQAMRADGNCFSLAVEPHT
jgi:hypothetical protein